MQKFRNPNTIRRFTGFDAIIYTVIILALMIWIIPFAYMIALSFSSAKAIINNQVSFWPVDFTVDAYQQVYVEIIETNLNDILSPFLLKITSKYLSFTPKEIQVATLIKEGKGTKEIARLMKVGKGAVDLHRHHIRNKLGLNNKKVNLRSYLSSLS